MGTRCVVIQHIYDSCKRPCIPLCRATFQKPTWIAVSYPGKAPVVVKDFGGTLAANGISKETFEMTDGDSFNPAEPRYIVFFIDCGSDSYDFTCYAGDRGECSLNA